MLRWTLATALAVGALLAVVRSARAEEPVYKVGVASRHFVPARPYDWRAAATHALVTQIWYPAGPSARDKPQRIGPAFGPAFFTAGSAATDAAIADRPATFPLILMSHGTGGSAQALAWLETALAAHGYMVAAVNHPGNNALEAYTTQGFALWWERARFEYGARCRDRGSGVRAAHRSGSGRRRRSFARWLYGDRACRRHRLVCAAPGFLQSSARRCELCPSTRICRPARQSGGARSR